MTATPHRLPDEPFPETPRPAGRWRRVSLAVLTGLLLGLWLAATPPGLLGKADAIGYAICHRIPERSLHTHLHGDDRPLPLCARCTGIYLGVAVGLGMLAYRGRLRTGRLPRVRWIAVLILLDGLYGLDGLNSYLTMFPGYRPLYAPHNTLRLLSGLSFGLSLIVLVLPAINALTWRAPLKAAPIAGWRDFAALYAAAGVVGVLVLTNQPAIMLAAGLISVSALVLLFVLLGGVLVLSLTRRENQARTWADLAMPVLGGFLFALLVLGGIDLARYVLTGTWAGFEV